jgi:hypothetical protein
LSGQFWDEFVESEGPAFDEGRSVNFHGSLEELSEQLLDDGLLPLEGQGGDVSHTMMMMAMVCFRG